MSFTSGVKHVRCNHRRLKNRLDKILIRDKCKDHDVSLYRGEKVAIKGHGLNYITVYTVIDLASISKADKDNYEALVEALRNRDTVSAHNVPIGCKKVRNMKPQRYGKSRSGHAKNRAAATYRRSTNKLERMVENASCNVEHNAKLRAADWRNKSDTEKLLSRQAIKRQFVPEGVEV